MSEKVNAQPKRRGRKPFGDRAMTPAERKRASRLRQSQSDSVEFMLRLSGGTLRFVDQMAIAHGTTRIDIIELLLDLAIAKVANTISQAEHMRKTGASEDEVTDFQTRELSTAPGAAAIDRYKELLGIT